MNKRKIRNNFYIMIGKEEIPSFNTVKPLLRETGSSLHWRGNLKTCFFFYSVFLCIVAVMVITGFLYHSPFPESVASEYCKSNFALHASERLKRAKNFLYELEF